MIWKAIGVVLGLTVCYPLAPFVCPARAKGPESPKPHEYFSNPWTVVGLKDYRDGTRIAPDGTLFLGEEVKCRFLVGESYSPLPATIWRSLEKESLSFSQGDYVARSDAALPIVHLLWRAREGVRYEFIIFASPLNPSDTALYDRPAGNENHLNQVCIRIRSDVPRTIEAPVGLSLSRACSAPQEIEPSGGTRRYVCKAEERLALLVGVPEGTSAEKVGDSLRWKVPIPPESAAEVTIVLPHGPLGKGELPPDVVPGKSTPGDGEEKAVAGTPPYFAEVHGRTKAFWTRLLRKGAVVSVPEEKPSLIFSASICYTFIGRDGTVIKPGEGFYDDFYLRDGAFQVHSLDLAGFTAEARESLAHFLRFQRPDGQFVSQAGELDGNGQALWALYAHYALTRDAQWLNQVYPAVRKSVSWLGQARQTTAPLDSPYFGVLFASIADGENLMQTPKHIVGYDFWNLRGVDCAAHMAEALGKESDAREFRRLFQEYRGCVEDALGKSGADWFPPSYEGEGTSWGNLTMLHPTRLFEPWAFRVTATLDHVRAGFVEGTIRWSPETMRVIHPYMGTYVTNSEIVRGESEKAVDHFYHFLSHTTSTHGFPEGVYYETRTAWNNTLPHLWAAAQYIILLRNMLLRSDDEVLHLLPAVPVGWLRPGKQIVVVGAPTVFGKVSFRLSGIEGGGELRFSWPERTEPRQIILHIPPAVVVRKATQEGKQEIPTRGNAVVLPKGCDGLRIEWRLPPEERDRSFAKYAGEYEKSSP